MYFRCISRFLSPVVLSLIWLYYQTCYLFAEVCVCVCVCYCFPSVRPCSLAPLSSSSTPTSPLHLLLLFSACSHLTIRLLPFLRLSLTRQKATWGMTGPTWLTLAAVASAGSILMLTTHDHVENHQGPFCLVVYGERSRCSSALISGAEMLPGQTLVSVVSCRLIIAVLWLCFGNRQLVKMFGTSCHADAWREPWISLITWEGPRSRSRGQKRPNWK